MNKISKMKVGKEERDFLCYLIAHWIRTGDVPNLKYTTGPRDRARGIIQSLQFAASQGNTINATRYHRINTLYRRADWNRHILKRAAMPIDTHLPFKPQALVGILSLEAFFAEGHDGTH